MRQELKDVLVKTDDLNSKIILNFAPVYGVKIFNFYDYLVSIIFWSRLFGD